MRMLPVVVAIVMLSGCHHSRGGGSVADVPIKSAGVVSVPSAIGPEPNVAVKPQVVDVEAVAGTEIGKGADTLDAATRVDEANGQLEDIFYPYDRADLTESASLALQHDARLLASVLAAYPNIKVIVEGHCDERGSAEYNLALGDNRAARTAEALRGLGLTTAKLETVSYGKENPQCEEANEGCWQKNRRAHLTVRAAQ